jgi:hypothetical protein
MSGPCAMGEATISHPECIYGHLLHFPPLVQLIYIDESFLFKEDYYIASMGSHHHSKFACAGLLSGPSGNMHGGDRCFMLMCKTWFVKINMDMKLLWFFMISFEKLRIMDLDAN